MENAEGNRVLLVTSCRREGTTYPDRVGTYQCFDQVAVTRPMTKCAAHVPARGRIPEIMRRALRASGEGRPGVAHVDIPESILNGKGDFDETSILPPARYRRLTPLEPSDAEVEQAARVLAEASAPRIHAGSGVIHAGAFEELQGVAELASAPVTTSWAARGALPETSACAVPMIHVELTNRVRNEADLAQIVGSPVGETDWWGKPLYWRSPSEQRCIQVDLDADMLGLNKPVDLAGFSLLRKWRRRWCAAWRRASGW